MFLALFSFCFLLRPPPLKQAINKYINAMQISFSRFLSFYPSRFCILGNDHIFGIPYPETQRISFCVICFYQLSSPCILSLLWLIVSLPDPPFFALAPRDFTNSNFLSTSTCLESRPPKIKEEKIRSRFLFGFRMLLSRRVVLSKKDGYLMKLFSNWYRAWRMRSGKTGVSLPAAILWTSRRVLLVFNVWALLSEGDRDRTQPAWCFTQTQYIII